MAPASFTGIAVRTFTCPVCGGVWEVIEQRDMCMSCEIEWQNTLVIEYEEQEEALSDAWLLMDDLYHAQF